MKIGQAMAMELEHEAKTARSFLESIPADKWNWQAHAKSYTLAQLGAHLAEILKWLAPTVQMDVFEMDPTTYKPFVPKNKKELLAAFDKNLAEALPILQKAPDSAMMVTWRMRVAGRQVIEMPRIAVLRGFIISHLIHHRAQLGVYLRLNDVPVPKSYGPTADFPNM